jgi:membrane protein DedA with SNARE-associated domain
VGTLPLYHTRAPGGAEEFFTRRGGKAVFLARFVTGMRTFGALTAGMSSRMPWKTFFFYNVLGGVVWGSLRLVEHRMGQASAVLLAFLLVPGGVI